MNSRTSDSGDSLAVLISERFDSRTVGSIAQGLSPQTDVWFFSRAFDTAVISDGNFVEPSPLDRLRTRYLDPGKLVRLNESLAGTATALCFGEQIGYQLVLADCISRTRRQCDIVFHGQAFFSRRNRFLAWLAKNRGVRLLCLSEHIAMSVRRHYGFPPSRAISCGYGVDTDFFAPVKDARLDHVMSAGTASRDYRTLCRAASGLDVAVRIAADSAWHRERLNVGQAEVPSNVTFSSAGDYPGLRTQYADARFVVVPLIEADYACGYAVIAEAMAMGKAVITTRTQGRSDLVIEGRTGIYVPPNDPAALRSAMKHLLDDPQLAIDMGLRAREHVRQNHSLDRYCNRLMDAVSG